MRGTPWTDSSSAKTGLATERINYFDSMALAVTLMTRPRTWPAFLRSRLRQLRRRSAAQSSRPT
ncbi:MAG TPA: hypothetical protein VFS48_01775 [Solirubrobacterales bacterium]|nr:hypothetical protein [Solirubrobacterales bacterium]